jgi:hypothetical protein
MRALGISDLPLAMETGRVEVLIKFLSKALTTKRNHIKTQVCASMACIPILILVSDCFVNQRQGRYCDLDTRLYWYIPGRAHCRCLSTHRTYCKHHIIVNILILIIFQRSIVVELNKTGSTSVGAGDEPKDDSKDKFWPEVDKNIAIYYQTMNPAERQM